MILTCSDVGLNPKAQRFLPPYAMSVAVALPLLGLVVRYEGELYLPQFNEPDF